MTIKKINNTTSEPSYLCAIILAIVQVDDNVQGI